MKRWTIYANGTCFGTMAATVEEIEEEFGPEGRCWYRPKKAHLGSTTLVILRKR